MIDFQTAYPMPTRAAGVCVSQQECGKNLAIEGCQGKGFASKINTDSIKPTVNHNTNNLVLNFNPWASGCM